MPFRRSGSNYHESVLDDDEKPSYIDKTSGQTRRVTIINESGLDDDEFMSAKFAGMNMKLFFLSNRQNYCCGLSDWGVYYFQIYFNFGG